MKFTSLSKLALLALAPAVFATSTVYAEDSSKSSEDKVEESSKMTVSSASEETSSENTSSSSKESSDSSKESSDSSKESSDSSKEESDTESSESSSSSKSKSEDKDSDSKSEKADAKEAYATLFDDYQSIIEQAEAGADVFSLKESFADDNPYSSIIIDYLSKSAFNSSLVYATYDVNGDGQEELLVGSVSSYDGSIYPFGFYYLADEEPTLLAVGYVAQAGGSRLGFNIYDDGTVGQTSISSGTGDGRLELYTLPTDGGEAELIRTQEFNMGNTTNDELVSATPIETDSLEWQSMFDEE